MITCGIYLCEEEGIAVKQMPHYGALRWLCHHHASMTDVALFRDFLSRVPMPECSRCGEVCEKGLLRHAC